LAETKATVAAYVVSGVVSHNSRHHQEVLSHTLKQMMHFIQRSKHADTHIYMDDLYVRTHCVQTAPHSGWIDAEHLERVLGQYCEGCVDYLLQLYRTRDLPTDCKLRDAVVVVLYMHLAPLVIAGIHITKGDALLSAILPPYDTLPAVFGHPMASYTGTESNIRLAIERAIARPGVDLASVCFSSIVRPTPPCVSTIVSH
jgi:hypothetical protein